MLSRKAKLGVATLLLGAPSGASLSTLDLSKLSLDNLFPSSGGAPTSLKEQEVNLEDKKLQVGDDIRELNVSKQKEIISPELQDVKESIDLSKQETVDDKKSGATIKTTFSEIDREGKTLKLDQESESKFSQSRSKANRYLKDFHSGKAKIDAFSAYEESKTQRRKRRSPSSKYTFQPLTKEERVAFYEMYKIFEELETKQKELLPRVYTLEGRVDTVIPTREKPKSSELTPKLTQIGWNSQPQIRYTTERAGGYGKKSTPNQWIAWDKNPFKPFLTESKEYTDLIDKVKAAEKSKSSYVSSRRMWGIFSVGMGPDMVRSTYSGVGGYDNALTEAKEKFTNKIALKFLDWMGQHGSRAVS